MGSDIAPHWRSSWNQAPSGPAWGFVPPFAAFPSAPAPLCSPLSHLGRPVGPSLAGGLRASETLPLRRQAELRLWISSP
eukprot:9478196-Pyramimonas_sp.AAC.1